MTVALLTISDRPDLLRETLASLAHATGGELGDPGGSPFCEHVHVADQRHVLGFGGAIQRGWHRLRSSSVPFEYVLHVEDDWRFDAPVELDRMAAILAHRRRTRDELRRWYGVGREFPDLAQVALRRNAVAPAEIAAGGVVEQWPDAYTECWDGVGEAGGDLLYLEHELYFTTNPSLYRRDLLDLGWPEGARSEGAFTERCLAAGYRFALYGSRRDAPRVTHLGDNRRQGKGY